MGKRVKEITHLEYLDIYKYYVMSGKDKYVCNTSKHPRILLSASIAIVSTIFSECVKMEKPNDTT